MAATGPGVGVCAQLGGSRGLGRRDGGDGEAATLARGGPIGILAAAVADSDETLPKLLSDAFQAWRDAISSALETLRDNQLLAREADLDTLTTITLSAIEVGLLFAKTTRDSTQLRIALDGAIAHLRSHAPRAARARNHAPCCAPAATPASARLNLSGRSLSDSPRSLNKARAPGEPSAWSEPLLK